MKGMILWLLVLLICLAAPASALAEWELGDRAIIVNCNEYISLRKDATTASKRIERIALNETVNVLGVGLNGFLSVEHDGTLGYVDSAYMRMNDDYIGDVMELTDQQRHNINLFLSNFSEQRMGLYDEWDMNEKWAAERDGFLKDFAIQHLLFNRRDKFERVSSALGEARIRDEELNDAIWRYLKTRPAGAGSAEYRKSGDYYYLSAADQRTNGGFVSAYRVDKLGDSRYAVRFSIYGGDCSWENEDCRLTPGEAAMKYDRSDIGMAVIVVDGDGNMGSLDDRSTWRLERWIVGSHAVQNKV